MRGLTAPTAEVRARTSENMVYVTQGVAQFRSRWLCRKLVMIPWGSAQAVSRED
ncbi:hypothetical protein OG601_40515 [Streptomyces sp. NBC_01239]|uniref:hypothetical protein n=1 Tax=Streptomyces sp. NBC_01239 TaxID=2903792 RepID=UPI002259D96E|nr:hypothetical protein [Streptomyces sp. NBC_01239]MCX4816880.1 hypothetical protein [Streptomyces sp. NBC_01239]